MKTQEIYTQLKKALDKLLEAMNFPDDDPHKESTIQRFEYTFELSWKLMSSILKDQGIESYGVKNIIREAYKLGLLDEISVWFKYAAARNMASNIYAEGIANEVYNTAKSGFVNYVKDFLTKAKRYVGSEI